jgi:hypothetical protein
MEYIEDEIKNDFNSAYTIIKNRKETQLLQDFSDKLTPPKTSNESFEDFINRQNIDLSFDKDKVSEKFSFYNSSAQFDEIYNKLMEGKDFKADPNIFKSIYEILIKRAINKEIEVEKKKLEKLKFEVAEMEIIKYFGKLKFYDDIDSFSSYKNNINRDYDNKIKND